MSGTEEWGNWHCGWDCGNQKWDNWHCVWDCDTEELMHCGI